MTTSPEFIKVQVEGVSEYPAQLSYPSETIVQELLRFFAEQGVPVPRAHVLRPGHRRECAFAASCGVMRCDCDTTDLPEDVKDKP